MTMRGRVHSARPRLASNGAVVSLFAQDERLAQRVGAVGLAVLGERTRAP
jgi:hypothetical protein